MIPSIILVPIDFSVHSEHALDYACELSSKLGATVHLVNSIGAALPELTVAMTGPIFDRLKQEHERALEKLVEPRRGLAKIDRLLVKDGDARHGILDAAKELEADLIVMGTHGRSGIARVLLGSVAEYIVRRAPCSVLTIRAEPQSERRTVARPEMATR